MPAISPPARVLVTGANGFLGAWIVRVLLQRGYSVRGAVRSSAKGETMKNMLVDKEGDKATNFEYVVVSDICDEESFDNALEGIDAIMHTACPVKYTISDPQELIRPAVEGTLTVLRSAIKHGNIKRIIVTGSTASVVSPRPNPSTFDENDWNEACVKLVEEKGMDAGGAKIYMASKTLAEKAAWEFYQRHKAQISWDLVTIVPSLIHGPLADNTSSPSALQSSMEKLWEMLCTNSSNKYPFAMNNNVVDVRDVAELHVKAIEIEEAAGERIIASSLVLKWQEIVDIANALNPPFPGLCKGEPGAGKDVPPHVVYRNDKARRLLGFKFRDAEETYRDMFDDFKQRGWKGEASQ